MCAIVSGVLLGAKCGALSQLIYVMLGLLGLPVFSGGGGPAYVLQPSFGFVLGLVVAAWLTGCLAGHALSVPRIAAACSAALAALYLIGLSYMALILRCHLGQPLSFARLLWMGMLPFLPGDAVKILLCCLLCPRLVPHLGNMHE